MSLRLLRLAFDNPTYLARYFAAHPALARKPYAEGHAALMYNGFAQADFWTGALADLGYETSDVIANAEPLQRQWARQGAAGGGIDWNTENWMLEIAAAQVRAWQPDVLLLTDYTMFDAAFVQRLRAENPTLRLVLGWCGAPYHDPAVFRTYDAVLSNVPELVAHFRAEGHTCHHVRHAFEPRLLDRIKTSASPNVDFTFIGSIVRRSDFHLAREMLLLALLRDTNLRIYAPVTRPPRSKQLTQRAKQTAYDTVHGAQRIGIPKGLLRRLPGVRRVLGWKTRPAPPATGVHPRLLRAARPPLFGLAMYQQLRNSRVTLNTHIDISAHSASNMRLFEATGVGTCLLTDWKDDLPQLFEPDVEVVAYRNAAECAEKVAYLLAHPDERAAIAAAGQARTLRDYTTTHVAARLDAIIQEALG